VRIDNTEDFKSMLNDYGCIKIYRNGIRISGFGNPEDDWIGLDALSLHDPTIIPSGNQIVAMVCINSCDNPNILETTTRENLIRNDSFVDMLNFIKPFKKDANSTAHKVMEYLGNIDELAKLKIPEIVE
jgi:hypothetical protein